MPKKGYKQTPEHRAAMSSSLKGRSVWNSGKKLHYRVWNLGLRYRNGPQTPNDLLTYSGVHTRVRTTFGKPVFCQNLGCKATGGGRYGWANLDGMYDPEKAWSWASLCYPCHRAYDLDKIAIKIIGTYARTSVSI